MKFENTKVFNFEGAFRGMRNPYDSWDKADSSFGIFSYEPEDDGYEIAEAYYGNSDWRNSNDPEEIKQAENEIDEIQNWLIEQGITWDQNHQHGTWVYIGPRDLDLAQRLISGGPVHSKFLRQIMVSVDITAPFYWWKEFDTYKVGTVANSCSTMHKLASYPIEIDSFEIDDYHPHLPMIGEKIGGIDTEHYVETLIYFLEQLRQKYNETKDKRYWKELVRWLPEGWLQKKFSSLRWVLRKTSRLMPKTKRQKT